MENIKITNLFVFEPFNWPRCAGAIVVIADKFKEAVILARDSCTTDIDRKNGDEYDGVFSQETSGLEHERRGQWLLTKKLQVIDNKKPRVISDNWNYN